VTHICCPGCRLRFAPAVAAFLITCPACGVPPVRSTSAARLIGLRLVTQRDVDGLLLGSDAAAPEPPATAP
jgi:hypothetical protein